MTSSLLQSFETEKLPLQNRQNLLAHIDCCVENCWRYLTTEETLAKYGGFIEGFQTNFATFYGEHDRFDDAELLFLKSLTFQVQSLGHQNIATLATLNNLGAMYLDARQLENAKGYLMQSLQVKEAILGPHHFRTLNSVNNIGNLLVLQQNFDGANQMYKRTLEGYTNINGPMHKTVLEALNNLGEVAMKKNDYEKAENIFKDAFTKARTLSNGKDDALVLYLASNIALLFKLQRRYHESIQVYSDVIVGREKLMGENHSSTLQSMCEVADVYKALGDQTLAFEWYQRGKASQERRQRGEPLPRTISRPTSEATTMDTDVFSRLSLKDTAGSNASSSGGENDNGSIISGQGEPMEWESETTTLAIDRSGRSKLNLPKRTIQAESSQKSTQVNRGGLALHQYIDTAAAPTPNNLSRVGEVERVGLFITNIGHYSPLKVDGPRSPVASGTEIERTGIPRRQLANVQARAVQLSRTNRESFEDPQAALTPQGYPAMESAASDPSENLAQYGRLKRNHPSWGLGDDFSNSPQRSPPIKPSSSETSPQAVWQIGDSSWMNDRGGWSQSQQYALPSMPPAPETSPQVGDPAWMNDRGGWRHHHASPPVPQYTSPSMLRAREMPKDSRQAAQNRIAAMEDRGGLPMMQGRSKYIELSNISNVEFQALYGNEATSTISRPRSDCEYIERGGVCMHNVFHQK